MTFEEIKSQTAAGDIDTVLTCIVDMQGRLMGKRFQAEAFLEMAEGETHCCNYLLATDLEMATPDGYASTSWEAGYGDGTKAVRVECRTPGSDMNPYLAMAAMLAAGLKGIEEKLALPEPFKGDAYADDETNHIPRTLRDARDALLASDMLKDAFGEETVAHYARAAGWEIEEFNRVVTDYEIARGFEKA